MTVVSQVYATESCRGCGRRVSRPIEIKMNKTIPGMKRVRCKECGKTNPCTPDTNGMES